MVIGGEKALKLTSAVLFDTSSADVQAAIAAWIIGTSIRKKSQSDVRSIGSLPVRLAHALVLDFRQKRFNVSLSTDVRFWHKADTATVLNDVCFRG